MNKRWLIIIIIFLFTYSLSFSQKQTITFESQLHDFGQVAMWNNPPAYFIFTNTAKTDLLFLPTFKRDDIFVELPKGKIKAGQSDTAVVYYFTNQTGEFQKSVELYTSNSNSPVSLTVKGNILSLDPKAYISCPGFAPKTDRVDELALVLDSAFNKNTQPQVQVKKEETMVFEEPEIEKIKTETIITDNGLLPENLYSPNNIIFLIDISSSMKKPDKLPLLKISMKNLTAVLRKIDFITVIVYSTTSTILMPPTTAGKKEEITLLIDTLKTKGITNGVKGLQTAYQIAQQNFIPNGNNQIIIATDGLFNSPGHSESELYSLVREKTQENIILSVVGFGDDKEAVRMMKKMADKGNGSFIQIPDKIAADEILIDEIKTQSAIAK